MQEVLTIRVIISCQKKKKKGRTCSSFEACLEVPAYKFHFSSNIGNRDFIRKILIKPLFSSTSDNCFFKKIIPGLVLSSAVHVIISGLFPDSVKILFFDFILGTSEVHCFTSSWSTCLSACHIQVPQGGRGNQPQGASSLMEGGQRYPCGHKWEPQPRSLL